jgi:hypothetical protein
MQAYLKIRLPQAGFAHSDLISRLPGDLKWANFDLNADLIVRLSRLFVFPSPEPK